MEKIRTCYNWLDMAKKAGDIIEVGSDYLTADGRILRRAHYRAADIWVDEEAGYYYPTLIAAYDNNWMKRKDLRLIIKSRNFWF